MAFDAEVAKRGLHFEPPDGGNEEAQFQEGITLRQFRDLPEALLAKGCLESAGIAAYLVDDNMIRMDWFISNLLGGVKLKVRPEDAEAANEILNQPIPKTLEVEGFGNYEQPSCPYCQSLDISFEELNKTVAYVSAYARVPMPIHREGWTCHTCGKSWTDEEAAAP